MKRLVVLSPDVVGSRMAGPGIRAYHLADELGRHYPTTLIARFDDFSPAGESFEAASFGSREARTLLREADAVIGQPVPEMLRLRGGKARLAFDLFDPLILELRELYGDGPTLRQRIHYSREWNRLRSALGRGDLLIAATRAQRDFYTGIYRGEGGSSPEWLSRWVEVPFGIGEPPVIQGLVDLPEDPPLVVWNGGVWEWLDAGLAIEATRSLNERGTSCRLLFLGAQRPNAKRVAAGRDPGRREDPPWVIRNDGWVPYRERQEWLGRCKIAIMLHRHTFEAEYSIRTRLFDAIWCDLPVVTSRGGFAADLVAREGIGVVVEPSNAESVTAGIEKLLRDDVFYASCVSRLQKLKESFAWRRVVEPLRLRLEELV